jgi:hypothetical protein
MKNKKHIPTLDKTQNIFFNLCLVQYEELEGGEPTLEQEKKLIDFISDFNVLEQTKVITPMGKVLDTAKKFHLWWKENFDEINKILFVY